MQTSDTISGWTPIKIKKITSTALLSLIKAVSSVRYVFKRYISPVIFLANVDGSFSTCSKYGK